MTNSNGQKKRGKSSKKSTIRKPAAQTKCEESEKRKNKDSFPSTDRFSQLMKVIKDYFKRTKKKATR